MQTEKEMILDTITHWGHMADEEFVIPAAIEVKGCIIEYTDKYYLGTAIIFRDSDKNGLLYFYKSRNSISAENISSIKELCESDKYIEFRANEQLDLSTGAYFIAEMNFSELVPVSKEKLAVAEEIRKDFKVQQIKKRRRKYVVGFSSAAILSKI